MSEQLSPDGKWRWDGQAWQPVDVATPQSQPAQPRISDDGKFYWDGARWVPMPGAATTTPTQEPLELAKFAGTRVVLYANRIEVEQGFGLKKREVIVLKAITDVSTKPLIRALEIRTSDGKKHTINASDPKAAREAILARL